MANRLLLFSFLLFYSACHSPEELLLAGRYDAAIRGYAQNLRKTEHVIGLEKAYQIAQRTDFEKINQLLEADSSINWLEIHAGYQRIQKRQYAMLARMPIRSKDGYSPQFEWLANIDSLEYAAREYAADQLYATALPDLELARLGDKLAARNAYSILRQLLKNYFREWRDSAALLAEAERLGTDYVLAKQMEGYSFNGRQFLQDLDLSNCLNSSAWTEYHTSPVSDIVYSYIAQLSVESVDIGYETRTETTRTEEKDIEVRVEITYDTSGNVIDRTPIYEKVQAQVTETRIVKNSSVLLRFELLDGATGTLLYWDTDTFSTLFDKTWVEISGDQRALNAVPCLEISIPSAPSDWTTVSGLADAARGKVQDWFWSASLHF